MEVGQGPNWGCSAKEKKIVGIVVHKFFIYLTPFSQLSKLHNVDQAALCHVLEERFREQ
jgi:hypothetical protein